ncbi:uncharacterized protein LOC6648110 [Drosophila willistoni]|nr:uncharacterized protein LOC6648110 [Drosophila willistoni]
MAKHSGFLIYLQGLGDVAPDAAAQQVAHAINKEVRQTDTDEGGSGTCINQSTLNMNFRVYYHIVYKYGLEDKHFQDLPDRLNYTETNLFLMLQSILLTEHWSRLDCQLLERKCLDSIKEALKFNSSSLMAILKATNLLVKKFPKLELLPMKLDHFYHCLQRQSQAVGSREETLTLFNHCCRQKKRAYFYFHLIMEFWPWTNRNKYYLLSGILNSHPLNELLDASGHSEVEFFQGLRLSLSYKGLRAASQYPVKSLSNQRSAALLGLAVDLLVNGSVAELQNFYSQWFLRIQERDVLFQLLQSKPEIVEFLASSEAARTPSEQLRLVLIFSMFAKEIYAASKLHFFKISTELLTNCHCLEMATQLMVFKFLVDNLTNFAVEDCLEFFNVFIERHRNVDNAEFRNTLLGKMPIIINHTAKHYNRALKVDHLSGYDALAENIKRFFSQLQELIQRDVKSDIYQPKIFALKLLEILNKSLYAEQVIKNTKMCSTQQNQQLGAYLLESKVFQPKLVSDQLFGCLNDPQGFDDALELIVSLLLQLNHIDPQLSVEQCLKLCQSSEVDECSLVSLYAQLAGDQSSHLYEQCVIALNRQKNLYLDDPLQASKSNGGHLFGYLAVLNEMVKANIKIKGSFLELLPHLEDILNGILRFLNLANIRNRADNQEAGAASFQDMDESLQLLVSESSYNIGEETPENCRKYLLMSFWLTLKGCCDLSTSIGCSLLNPQAEVNFEALQRCLDINVAVLIRCRHKGAIEAAGLSIGRLTRNITQSLDSHSQGFVMLHECLDRELLSDSRQVSTTRRGAGFAIMFLHVLKNDNPRQRLLLHRAVQRILQRLSKATTAGGDCAGNLDRWEALALHYLCVLVRDTELRPAMSKYYNEIMLVAMEHIDHAEWTISNAALQLYGASLGKLAGQRQATEFEMPLAWEPCDLNYDELSHLLPKASEQMLQSCQSQQVTTSSIILFLGFLSKIEHLRTSGDRKLSPMLHSFRRLSWQLLRHKCEQVRQLAATCFVRSHEFRCDLPAALLASAKVAAHLNEDNFYEGLLYTLHAGVLKLQHEARHVWTAESLDKFLRRLLATLEVTEQVRRFKPYTLNVLLELSRLLNAKKEIDLVQQLLKEASQLEAA